MFVLILQLPLSSLVGPKIFVSIFLSNTESLCIIPHAVVTGTHLSRGECLTDILKIPVETIHIQVEKDYFLNLTINTTAN